ncbi:B12-binding domain-containing radical SAM protein [Patescibacteria group bacterium]|nr:B12-binding domain-containing radical SAM protein [Patescibacteria group bacterium]
MSIASYLDAHGLDTKILDQARQRTFWDSLGRELADAEYVGLSVMTTQIPNALKVTREIKKNNPNVKIIWGGIHPTLFPRETLAEPLIDFVVYGEGEVPLLKLIRGVSMAEIKGLGYKHDTKCITNPPGELFDLNELPVYNWNLLPQEILEKMSLVPLAMSRGCPHRCAFCINTITKNKWRSMSLPKIIENLRLVKKSPYLRGKYASFSFEENFFVNKERVKEICKAIISESLLVEWEAPCRADYIREGFVDDELLTLLKRAGLRRMGIGAESGSNRVLALIKKDLTAEQTIYANQKLAEHGISPYYGFMVGLPGETWDDVIATLNLIDRIKKDNPQAEIMGPQPFRLYPGSELYNECINLGWKSPKSLNEWKKVINEELNYLNMKNYPWVKNPAVIEAIDAYARFGSNSFRQAMALGVSAPRIFKFLFAVICKIRWKLRFFRFPYEYLLAKKLVTLFSRN